MTGPGRIWIDGTVFPAQEARIPALDRGVLYGDGLFETMRSYRGHVFRIGDHLARLARSAQALRIPLQYSTSDLAGAISGLLDGTDQYIRLTLTRGVHPGTLGLDTGQPPMVMIHAKPFAGCGDALREGVRLCIADARRNEASPAVRHKTLNYLDSLLARSEAAGRGCTEALMLNTSGMIAECAASNIFWVRDKVVQTPAVEAGLLPGITRGVVIELCRELGLPVSEGRFPPADIYASGEAFLTNSLMQVAPVLSIEDWRPPAGAPGPVTQQIMQAYQQAVTREQPAIGDTPR